MPLWFLWLRKGDIGTVASGLRAFDQWNKPAPRSLRNWLFHWAWLTIYINLVAFAIEDNKRKKAELEKEAQGSDPQTHSDEAGNNPSEDPKQDAAPNDKTQEETPDIQPAAEDKDQASGKDKD